MVPTPVRTKTTLKGFRVSYTIEGVIVYFYRAPTFKGHLVRDLRGVSEDVTDVLEIISEPPISKLFPFARLVSGFLTQHRAESRKKDDLITLSM